MNYIKAIIASVFSILALSSCIERNYAADLEGSWKMKSQIDTLSTIPELYYEFIYGKSDSLNGCFNERIILHLEEKLRSYTIPYKVECTISGDYKVQDGCLFTIYNLSSLSVTVIDDDLDFIGNATRTIKKNLYSVMYDQYKTENQKYELGYCHPGLHISEDKLSFKGPEENLEFIRTNNIKQ